MKENVLSQDELTAQQVKRRRLFHTIIILGFFVLLGFIGVWQYGEQSGERDIEAIHATAKQAVGDFLGRFFK